MECRACRTPLVGDERACPSCFAYIERDTRPPPAPEPAPIPDRLIAEGALAVEAVAEPAPENACPVHPARSTAGVCSRCGTFICRECDPHPELISALCPTCRERAAKAVPTGIGGWLIIPAIWCVLGPPVNLAATVVMVGALVGAYRDELAFYAGVSGLMTVYLTFLSVQFFRKKASVPVLMMVALVLQCLIAFISMASAEPGSDDTGLFRSIGALLVWGPYFAVSQRVKATFVR